MCEALRFNIRSDGMVVQDVVDAGENPFVVGNFMIDSVIEQLEGAQQ